MEEFRRRVDFNAGSAEFDAWDHVRVGDRLVARLISVEFPSAEGQPRLDMTIDSTSGIPRCTDLRISSVENGREVRTTDVRAVAIDYWIEAVVSLTADLIAPSGQQGLRQLLREPDPNSENVKAAKAALKQAMRAGRRKVTPDLLQRVAEVYLKDDLRPAEGVQLAFRVSPRTAFRYIALAREQGFLPVTERSTKREA